MRVGSTLVRKEDGKEFKVVLLGHWSDLIAADGEKVSVKLYGSADNGPDYTNDLRIGTNGGTFLLKKEH